MSYETMESGLPPMIWLIVSL